MEVSNIAKQEIAQPERISFDVVMDTKSHHYLVQWNRLQNGEGNEQLVGESYYGPIITNHLLGDIAHFAVNATSSDDEEELVREWHKRNDNWPDSGRIAASDLTMEDYKRMADRAKELGVPMVVYSRYLITTTLSSMGDFYKAQPNESVVEDMNNGFAEYQRFTQQSDDDAPQM
jgi:hypothetical protein